MSRHSPGRVLRRVHLRGRTVTRDSVEDHGDAVLYRRPQGWQGGPWRSMNSRLSDTLLPLIDPSVRNDVVPGEGQTVRQAAETAAMGPRTERHGTYSTIWGTSSTTFQRLT